MTKPAGLAPTSSPFDPSQATGEVEHAGDACARAWVAWRAVYAMITDTLAAELGKEFGLALNEFEVLTALQPRPEAPTDPVRLRLGDLGRYVTLSQPAISRLVTRLEDRGLVRRLDGAADRRSVLVEATPAGIDLYRRAAPVHAAAVAQHLGGHLTDVEQEALVALMTRLHDKAMRRGDGEERRAQ